MTLNDLKARAKSAHETKVFNDNTKGKFYGILDANYIAMASKNMMVKDLPQLMVTLDDFEGKKFTTVEEVIQFVKDLQCNKNIVPINKGLLYKTFIMSVMKYKRDYGFGPTILCWDRSPYHKKQAIVNYKADRYIATDDEVTALSKLIIALDTGDYSVAMIEGVTDETSRDLKKAELLQKISYVLLDMQNFSVFQDVKYDFLHNDNLKASGFKSIGKKGFEADDLAYLCARKIEEMHGTDENYHAILVSADKDWANFISPNVKFISCFNQKDYSEYNTYFKAIHEDYRKYCNEHYGHEGATFTQYDYGILNELCGMSHNNMGVWNRLADGIKHRNDFETYVDENGELKYKLDDNNLPIKKVRIPYIEYVAKVLNEDNTLPDYDIVRKAYVAANMIKGSTPEGVLYLDDISAYINFTMSSANKYNPTFFSEECKRMEININPSVYLTFTEGLTND